jgi:hypothetical protein
MPFKGTNLGGWLVAESWIRPVWWKENVAVPEGSGEWQLCAALGPTASLRLLEDHWDSWVTQTDLKALQTSGLTHLRIPLGYWALPAAYGLVAAGEPYVVGGAWPYLLRALSWCKGLGLSVILGLHGAPGSQNGKDHSGNTDGTHWQEDSNIDRTLSVLSALAHEVVLWEGDPTSPYRGVVVGIEVLNEPATTVVGGPVSMDALKAFVKCAVDAIRGAGFSGAILYPDGWDIDWPGWENFLTPADGYFDVFMDCHLYYCFGGPVSSTSMTRDQLLTYICGPQATRLNSHHSTNWLVVAEYSLCLPENLAPVPVSPKSGGGGPGGCCSAGAQTAYSSTDKAYLSSLFQAQQKAYGCTDSASSSSTAKGGFFWNFKTESRPSMWSYLYGVEQGIIPGGGPAGKVCGSK